MTFTANASLAALALATAVHGNAGLAAQSGIAVIPAPASITRASGEFVAGAGTALVVGAADTNAKRVAAHVGDLIERTCGVRLPVRRGVSKGAGIHFLRTNAASMGPEAYRLDVRPARVTITARTDAGLLYGGVTLWQLLCPGAKPGEAAPIAAMRIDDAPRFAWRGLMLDSARHYQSPSFIRQFIDWMALHKLNVLHWHLTDDQAWRLEIRKYPLLTSVGAWRVPAGPAAQADIDPATGKPRLYGGFYSRDDVRAIVAHAAARGVTIVPEIDVPGHASAAIAAYPRLAAVAQPSHAVPSDWGIYANVYNLDEPTFAFLEDVLGEVIALFPGKFIHVGGDEVVKAQWQASPRVKARMASLGIKDAAAIQTYFAQRMGRFLQAKGRRLVGWDEILEPGLPKAAVVMSWRGIDGALAAAAKGHDTVLSAWPTLYFDNRQADVSDPPGRARIISVEDVYGFEPMPAKLTVREQRHVLGLQGNVWTEHIRTEERVALMTWPRAAAVAELGWSAARVRDWPDFRRRLGVQFARYDALRLPYSKGAPEPAAVATGQKLPLRRTSHQLKLCSENIALSLEDDAPLAGGRATFLVDIMDPCWIATDVDLESLDGVVASVGQVPFNFQIGEDIHKIVFPKPLAPEGELEVHLGDCKGAVIARLPVKPALASQGVTVLPRAEITARPGRSDLCLRFAQNTLEPLWVLDWIELTGRSP